MLEKKRTLLCENCKRTMKSRIAILFSMFVLAPSLLVGQEYNAATQVRTASVVTAPRSEWLGSFDGISVNGMMHVHIIGQPSSEGPRIVYDTKGEASPRFKAAVDKYGILRIEEPVDSKRTTVTEVTVYCNALTSLNVAAADLVFDTTVDSRMFDLYVSGGANVRGRFEVADLSVEATGRSSIVLDGSARYLTLNVSTAKFDGSSLQTVSSIVDASHGAEVSIAVSERIEAATATSAKISYKGRPDIVRLRTTMFGGEITASGE